jgi:septum formation protein
MLKPYIEQLNSLKIALASASPRRKDILEQAGVTFTITPNHFLEDLRW